MGVQQDKLDRCLGESFPGATWGNPGTLSTRLNRHKSMEFSTAARPYLQSFFGNLDMLLYSPACLFMILPLALGFWHG